MTAYYNEIDRFCCDWLSNLMDAELITPGKIDDRSIVDIRPSDLAGFERVHFFAGIGGWDHSLNLAGWSGPVWTGSCPCQPFSLAGAQKGFSDERHLWPVFRDLIAQRRPATVFGEQVASATEWLGLVRGDLEAMGYAVGALPVQAASAGADHLRDRYWFVANADDAGSQGRRLLPECASQRPAGPDGLANPDQLGAGEERQQRSRQLGGAGGDQKPRAGCGDLADAHSNASGAGRGNVGEVRGLQEAQREPEHGATLSGGSGDELCWVIGADGKARRVKPGIRLLAHGVPNRVGLLRGFGNAIDPRPAAAFISAFMTVSDTSQLRPQGE